MTKAGNNTERPLVLPIYLTASLFILLIAIMLINPAFAFILNNILAAGLALAITGYSLLVRQFSHDESLDVLGSGMLVIALNIIAMTIAIISPQLFSEARSNLTYQLWVMCQFFEGLTVFLAVFYAQRTREKTNLSWILFPIFSLVSLLPLFLNIPFLNYYYSHDLSVLSTGFLICALILLLATTILSQFHFSQKNIWWAKTLSFSAILIILGGIIPSLFHGSTPLNALGSLVHFSAFYLIFFSILSNIILDPLGSIYREIATERNQYARWEALSQHLLNFYAHISNIRTVEELQSEALKPLTLAFADDFIALYKIAEEGEIRYLCAPLYEGYPLKEHANMTQLENQMRAYAESRATASFTLRSFLMNFLDLHYSFSLCPLIAGNDEEGFLLVGKKYVDEQEDVELQQRFYKNFSAIIALNLKNLRLESERAEQEKRTLVESNRIAQTLQEAIMPLKNPKLDDAHILIAPFLHAAPGLAKIGGDFYDAFLISDHLIGFTIGDISGHGVDAAAYNAMIRSAIRALGLQNYDPSEVLTATNRHILSELKGSLFATAIFGTLDTLTGSIRLCIAGHPRPLIVSKKGQREYESVQNPMLGFIDDFIYESFECNLLPNEAIVLYTDGLTEAQNPQGEQFGLERLINILTTKRGLTPHDTAKRLFNEVDVFCGAIEPTDDRAILIIRWHQEPLDSMSGL